MRKPLSVLVLAAVTAAAAGAAGLPVAQPADVGMNAATLSHLDDAIRATIRAGNAPGAVCIVGHKGRIVYRKAFGYRSLEPEKRPMTVDTVFDLASLTKVTATAPSIMKLIEAGKLTLRTDIEDVWPAYAAEGKGNITIRQFLTHSAGLSPGHGFFAKYGDRNTGLHVWDPAFRPAYTDAMADLAAAGLRYTPDSRFQYSDDGFMTLGEVVRRVSGEPLNVFAKRNIFEPLGMHDTTFLPGPALRARAAPTEKRWGKDLQGEVHDPASWSLGGVAGHAGLFSTADDLARYCQMYLNGGKLDGRRVLSQATVRAMTSPASAAGLPVRGLGWDIDSGYTKRGDLFSNRSFGHTGWTGTSVWVDPPSQTFVVLLTNRNHPNGGGNVLGLEWRISNIVAASVADMPPAQWTAEFAQPQPEKQDAGYVARQPTFVNTLTGIDVLEQDKFDVLKGRRIGLITNPTGIDRNRRATADLLNDQAKAGNLKLVAFFGPEHGIRADRDEAVGDSTDAKTGLPVYSLYDYKNKVFKPTPEMLKGIDTLVFDIQDIGVRYYTYITTMAHAMEAAKENNIRMVVLDRPNPVNGVTVDGPKLDLSLRSFAGYYPMPVRHGMTIGELAKFFNAEYKIGCDLTVVPMKNWYRPLWFDQTGQPWVNPSPNIRDLNEAALYPAIGLLEAANVSVGRGTDRPFELFGAPWIDDVQLSEALNDLHLPGLSFTPLRFTPTSSIYAGKECGGVSVQLLDRDALEGARSAVEILATLQRLYPKGAPDVMGTKGMFGTTAVPEAILAGKPASDIVASWQKDVADFKRARAKYLIYP
jgi:uncharacterized protein YbbC (DUF1343 family)/CubicO group peptidase (beta-lactamase class C family)